jgi:hypothetical protein
MEITGCCAISATLKKTAINMLNNNFKNELVMYCNY